MKNKTTVLTILALLSASLLLTACPHPVRPHVPRPHRLPRPLLPTDSMLQLERQNNAVMLSLQITKPATARIV